jgi:mono/diheme cytochrome c family protein
MRRARLALPACVIAALALSGCKDQSMRSQNRLDIYAPWGAGAEARTPPASTIARGDLAYEAEAHPPPMIDEALLQRGHERYDIYCAPCHGAAGYGDGLVAARGYPAPPSYHDPRLRAAPAAHFYEVITNGYGVMYSYAARVEPRDRWAIAAYIRALQLSQQTASTEPKQEGTK